MNHPATMPATATDYRIKTTVALPFERAVERTREELAREGFGILSEIDVSATLKKKIGVDMPPYVILGACNPPLAHQAIGAERDIGVLLPCNVIVYAADAPGKSVVAAVDPEASLARTGNTTLAPVAADVKARLTRVVRGIGGSA